MNRKILWVALCAPLVTACPDDLLSGGGLGGAEENPDGTENGGGNGATNGGGGDCADPGDPGRVTIHRMNRAEYNNTVSALFGIEVAPAEDFPPDDHGYGFDNNADVLSLSPLLIEKYERAAEELVELALPTAAPSSTITTYEAEILTGTIGAANGTGWNLWSNGELPADVQLASAGDYTLRARVLPQQAGPDPVEMTFKFDGQEIQTFSVTEPTGEAGIYEASITDVLQGNHTFAVRFNNDYYDPNNADPAQRDRNLVVDYLEVEGPFNSSPEGDPVVRARIFVCDPDVTGAVACAREIFATFGRRAWRRPLTGAELDRLGALHQLAINEGDDFDVGVKLGLRAILLSPHFIFRVELDSEPTSTAPHALTDHELAARLSYFIWSSGPDDELLQKADDGVLSDPLEIELQVRRMLEDPRARALVDNFAGQWLYTRAMDDVEPDYAVYDTFDPELRAAMKTETELFFEEFLQSDRSLLDLLDADFTFVNGRLAEHYGIPGITNDTFQRIALPAEHRSGILTHGSVLTVTSYPTRTSPVKRGKWVLEQLLCLPPAPPPPEVEGLPEGGEATGSFREQMEQHRADPACAGCHALMDPIGFGMENYDGIGAWRTEDAFGFPVDASGEFLGDPFTGMEELKLILKDNDNFPRCTTEKLMTYALGRGVEDTDACAVDGIVTAFSEGGFRLSELVVHIALSGPFRMRRGEEAQ
jgi:hypothetical protein